MAVEAKAPESYWWRRADAEKNDSTCPAAPHLGQSCQQCHEGEYELDGLLRLVCPACGHVPESGAFT